MITELTDNCIGVGVPLDATDFQTHVLGGIQKLVFSSQIQDPLKCGGDMLRLPDGSWELIGLAKDLTEDQWREVVELMKYKEIDKLYYSFSYKIYGKVKPGGAYGTQKSIESGLSLLKSKSINPDTTVILKHK